MRQYLQVIFTDRAISCYTLAGATIHIAKLVNYNCHPLEDDNKFGRHIRLAFPLDKYTLQPLITWELIYTEGKKFSNIL